MQLQNHAAKKRQHLPRGTRSTTGITRLVKTNTVVDSASEARMCAPPPTKANPIDWLSGLVGHSLVLRTKRHGSIRFYSTQHKRAERKKHDKTPKPSIATSLSKHACTVLMTKQRPSPKAQDSRASQLRKCTTFCWQAGNLSASRQNPP